MNFLNIAAFHSAPRGYRAIVGATRRTCNTAHVSLARDFQPQDSVAVPRPATEPAEGSSADHRRTSIVRPAELLARLVPIPEKVSSAPKAAECRGYLAVAVSVLHPGTLRFKPVRLST
jgi:hypothetical protein